MKKIEKCGQINVESEVVSICKVDGAKKLRDIVEWMNNRPEDLNENKSHLALFIEYNRPKTMNKRITTQVIVTRVISESGNYTRYDYLATNIGDDYVFMPYVSTFAFPQILNKWEISDIKTIEESKQFIKQTGTKYKSINPYTMLECINFINSNG